MFTGNHGEITVIKRVHQAVIAYNRAYPVEFDLSARCLVFAPRQYLVACPKILHAIAVNHLAGKVPVCAYRAFQGNRKKTAGVRILERAGKRLLKTLENRDFSKLGLQVRAPLPVRCIHNATAALLFQRDGKIVDALDTSMVE